MSRTLYVSKLLRELANVESPVLAGYKLKNWSLISDEVDDLSRLGLKGYAPKFKTVRYTRAKTFSAPLL